MTVAAQRKALLDRLCEAASELGELNEIVARAGRDGTVDDLRRQRRAEGRLRGLKEAAEIVLVGDDDDARVPF